jgi:glycosyltransferase involved in cell wall biosynthesis
MKVLVVGRALEKESFKGFTRYTLELYEGLKQYCEVDLYTVGINEIEKNFTKEKQALIPLKLLANLSKLHLKEYDVIHALDPLVGAVLPFINNKTVVTFHDLIPLTMPGKWKHETAIQAYFWLMYKMAAACRHIIADSTQTAAELVRILKVTSNKISVVNLGVDEKFNVRKRIATNMPIIGFFGNYCYRKRVDIAVEVYKKLRAKGINCDLILAGGKIAEPSKIQFEPKTLAANLDNVTYLDYIPEIGIVDLYQSFDILLYPSENEGFGLHILEAQRCGVPVLIMKNAYIPAEVKEAAVKCDSVDDMVNQVNDLVTKQEYYHLISNSGIEYSKSFTWENTVQQTLAAYAKIMEQQTTFKSLTD